MKNILTVIIPVYNTEQYVKKCVESITAQSYANLEIILVNDGSTDSSGEICDEFTQRDGRIKVIHKNNGGVVSARKAGLEAASGDYIGFVDSDDWVDPQMYENLYKTMMEFDADMVSSGYIREGNYISYDCDSIQPGIYAENMQNLYSRMIMDFETCGKGISGSLCNKLIKADIIKAAILDFPENISLSEDKLIVLKCLLECRRVYVLNYAYYHYIIRNGSATSRGNEVYLDNVSAVYKYFSCLYKHRRFTSQMRVQAELYITQLLLKGINPRLGFSLKNLMWVDPSWLNNLPDKSRVVLYGAGDLGKTYYTHLENDGRHKFVGCIDENYRKMSGYPFDVEPIERICDWNYDCVVITIKDEKKTQEIKKKLIAVGVDGQKLLWFDQQEIFWRFAEAMGVLKMK